MPSPYATPLRLEPQRSVQMAGWLLAGHLPAWLLLPAIPLTGGMQLLLAAALLLQFWYGWRRHVVRTSAQAVRALVWRQGSALRIEYADGSREDAELLPQAFILPWLVIIGYRSRQRHHHLVLLPDMLPPATLRRLRVRLRIQLDSPEEPAKSLLPVLPG